MHWIDYLAMALILAGGGTLQSAAGFGYGLFCMPLLLLLGLAPYEAIPLVTVATIVQGIFGVWHHRPEVPWRLVGVCSLLVIAMIPVGVFLLARITLLDEAQVKQVFGLIVLVMVLFYAAWQPHPRPRVHPAWTAAAMLTGGGLAGLCGMSGPPIVLWAMTHEWSGQKTRATLWALFLAMAPMGLLFLYQRFGADVLHAAGLSLLMTPAVLAGSIPGMWIGNRIPKPLLRRLAIVLLLVLAGYMTLRPMLG